VARVCHERNILLLVDNAHGAYLKFLPESRHPMDLGADLCCDSAHKTLPVLTGGAYLHIAQNADSFFVQNARNALSLFGSTSPSYLILQSLDLANRYIANGYRERLVEWGKAICAMQTRLTEKGYRFLQNEPLKLTVDAKAYGYRGDEMAEFLRDKGIEVEFSDPDVLVMMFTPELTKEDLFVTENALLSLEKREKLTNLPPKYHRPERVLAAWEAISAPAEQVSAGDAVGRILACPTVGCPPAVPILTCGERIDEDAIALARYYGIESFKVVKE
jgi:arginine/lysine/ornithine decarboxylase